MSRSRPPVSNNSSSGPAVPWFFTQSTTSNKKFSALLFSTSTPAKRIERRWKKVQNAGKRAPQRARGGPPTRRAADRCTRSRRASAPGTGAPAGSAARSARGTHSPEGSLKSKPEWVSPTASAGGTMHIIDLWFTYRFTIRHGIMIYTNLLYRSISQACDDSSSSSLCSGSRWLKIVPRPTPRVVSE